MRQHLTNPQNQLMSQLQQDSSFSFQEQQQVNEQQQLMKRMLAMQREYEQLRLRYEMIINKRLVNDANNSNSNILQGKSSCPKQLIQSKPHLNLPTISTTNFNTILSRHHQNHQLQPQQQSFSFQNSTSSISFVPSITNNILTSKDTDPHSLSTDTFVYNDSKVQSFQYQEESYINKNDEAQNTISQNNKQVLARQSILSNSKQQSFEFKEYDSIPAIQNNGKATLPTRKHKNVEMQQSFTYKSSTGDEESFSYQASDRSLASVHANKQAPPLTKQITTTKQQNSRIQSENEDSFVFNNDSGQPIAKIENIQKQQRNNQVSQDGSFEPSRSSNGGNYEYNIREFSFKLPNSILDPFEINTQIQPIMKDHPRVQLTNPNITTTKATSSKPHNHNRNNPITPNTSTTSQPLTSPSSLFTDQYSNSSQQQQQFIFLKKLVNKLNLRNNKQEMSIKEIKRLSAQMKLMAEKNVQLLEIFETGTYELDYYNKGGHIGWTQKYIDQVNSWNTKMFITQLTMNSMQSKQDQENFFKQVYLPSLQQLSIYYEDLSLYKDGYVYRQPNEQVSINFLRHNDYSKRLKTLSLRGQTMVLQLAKNLVDLDFPNLRSLYIGFEAHLTNEIIEILTCTEFSNMPKCGIYIANWDGDINTRFSPFYKKIKFITLQQGQQLISNQQLKYRARQMSLKHSQKLGWKQQLNKDLGNYFQSSQRQVSQS